MSEIDWQADLEKKVANLLRKFDKEVRAHGDELWVTVTVETTPVSKKASPTPKVGPSTGKNMRKVTDESDDATDGDIAGDD